MESNISTISTGAPASNILGAISGKQMVDNNIMSAADMTEAQKNAVQELADTKAAVGNQSLSPEQIQSMMARMKTKQVVRDYKKIGRNDLCPCGSGKKYKNCCLNKGTYEGTHTV